jgi:hypothetical protein
MAEKKPAERRKEKPGRRPGARPAQGVNEHQILRLERKNWILFGAGLASVALGFLLLRFGDITVAPILLVAGYLVLIPWALVARSKATKHEIGEKGTGPSV